MTTKKKSSIKESDVFDVATMLKKDNKNVSVRSVHAAIGHGSYTTISKYLNSWRESNEPGFVSAPDFLKEIATDAANKIWQECKKISDDEIEIIRNGVNIKGSQSSDRIEHLESLVSSMESDLHDKTKEIDSIKGQHVAAHDQIESLMQKLAEKSSEYEVVNKEFEKLAREYERIKKELAKG